MSSTKLALCGQERPASHITEKSQKGNKKYTNLPEPGTNRWEDYSIEIQNNFKGHVVDMTQQWYWYKICCPTLHEVLDNEHRKEKHGKKRLQSLYHGWNHCQCTSLSAFFPTQQ